MISLFPAGICTIDLPDNSAPFKYKVTRSTLNSVFIESALQAKLINKDSERKIFHNHCGLILLFMMIIGLYMF